jgi:gliding motility-associated-like protein
VAGPGVHQIDYVVVNGSCSDSDQIFITVDAYPNSDWTNPSPVCEADPVFNLIPNSPGGTWAGTGITDAIAGTFDPGIAGAGTHSITYTIVNGACTNFTTYNISVDNSVDATITPAGPFCENNAPINLSAVSPGGTWAGTGITNPATGTFDPAVAGPGVHQIDYVVVNGSCSDSDQIFITVDAYPNSDWTNPSPVCQSDAAFNLIPNIAGGTWSGNGITNPASGTFDPSIAGAGVHNISYTLINGACTSITTKPITVDAAVDATITPAGPFCDNIDPVTLTANSPGGIWSGNGIIDQFAGIFSPSVAGVGTHTIQYSVVNGTCSDSHSIDIEVQAAPFVEILTSDNFCENDPIQMFLANPAGGFWGGPGINLVGEFNPAIAGPGTHTISYLYSIGVCQVVVSVDITVDEFIIAQITSGDTFCFNDNPTYLTASNPGGVWVGDGLDIDGLFDPQAAGIGTHNISYTIVNGSCSSTDNQTLTVLPNPDATINDILPVCLNTLPFDMIAATSGGTWSGQGISDQISGTFDPYLAGVGVHTIYYEITVDGCYSIDSTEITVYGLPVVSITGLDPEYCLNSPEVIVNVDPLGGILSGNGIIGNIFNPAFAGAGTHSINYTYTDTNGCTNSTEFEVTVHELPTVSITDINNHYCENNDIVYPTLLPEGGTFEGPGVVGYAFDPLIAGPGVHELIYYFSDTNNCTDTARVTIQVTDVPQISYSLTEPSCFGYSDGSIQTSVVGGSAPYDYLWGDPINSAQPDLFDVPGGMYYITVTDSLGCAKVDSIFLNQPLQIAINTIIIEDPTCFQQTNGMIVVLAADGFPPYDYQWNDPGNTNSNVLLDVTAGVYTVTVTDNNGCSNSETFDLHEVSDILATINEIQYPSCFGYRDGMISLNLSGGTAPLTVVWNTIPPSSGTTLNNIGAGIYEYTVTDVNGCQAHGSVEIFEPLPIEADFIVTPVNCGVSRGSIITSTHGGTPPFTYEWSNGSTSQDLFNIPAGLHSVTITDANNCMIAYDVVVEALNGLDVSIYPITFNKCYKDEIASLTVSVSSFADNINYLWNNGSTNDSIFNLPAGIYSITVTDSWGCSGFDSIVVTQPELLEINLTTYNINCNGYGDGSASIIVTGGTIPYNITWFNGSNQYNLTNLEPGPVSVTVTDANGCIVSASGTISQPDDPLKVELFIQGISCFGAMDASINAVATGGVPPFNYYWYYNGVEVNGSTLRFLDAGTYNLTVTDRNGCIVDTSVVITQPQRLAANFITGPTSCRGNHDGYIVVNAFGGTPPYRYFMFDDIEVLNFVDSLFAGTYRIIVKDTNNCMITIEPIVVPENDRNCLNIPAAFSPNDDGFNDIWYIENIHLYPRAIIQIYNRWGQLLYEKRGTEGYWDGTYQGKPVPTGVYLYNIILNNEDDPIVGTVTVIR